jgi:hypothetical protein
LDPRPGISHGPVRNAQNSESFRPDSIEVHTARGRFDPNRVTAEILAGFENLSEVHVNVLLIYRSLKEK